MYIVSEDIGILMVAVVADIAVYENTTIRINDTTANATGR